MTKLERYFTINPQSFARASRCSTGVVNYLQKDDQHLRSAHMSTGADVTPGLYTSNVLQLHIAATLGTTALGFAASYISKVSRYILCAWSK